MIIYLSILLIFSASFSINILKEKNLSKISNTIKENLSSKKKINGKKNKLVNNSAFISGNINHKKNSNSLISKANPNNNSKSFLIKNNISILDEILNYKICGNNWVLYICAFILGAFWNVKKINKCGVI